MLEWVSSLSGLVAISFLIQIEERIVHSSVNCIFVQEEEIGNEK